MKRYIFWGLIFAFFCLGIAWGAANAQQGFYGGYCSMYTEGGDWDIAYGENSAEFYCMVVRHRLGPTYSPIVKKSVGVYDMHDMNNIVVECQDTEHSFEDQKFGTYGVIKAVDKASYLGGTSCLFKIAPANFKIGTILLGAGAENVTNG